MMIDRELVALVTRTKAALAKLKGRMPSEIMAEKERFGQEFLELLDRAQDGITVAHKIAAFDKLALSNIDSLKIEIKSRINGEWCDDAAEDTIYLWEDVRQLTLGENIFKATNELDGIL